MGFNYVLVFSPHPLASAPHSLAATITMPPDRDAPVTQALLRTFPGVSVVAVGAIVSQVGELLGQLLRAIVAAASVANLPGIQVLVEALPAATPGPPQPIDIIQPCGANRDH